MKTPLPVDGEASYVADKLAISAIEARPPTLHGFPRIGFGFQHQPHKRCRCFGCFNAAQVQRIYRAYMGERRWRECALFRAAAEQNVQRIEQLVTGSCLRITNPVPCWPTNVNCLNDSG